MFSVQSMLTVSLAALLGVAMLPSQSSAFTCTGVVKREAMLKNGSDVPYKGFVVYSGAGKKLTISPIEKYQPREIKDGAGRTLIDVTRLQISSDGQWIVGAEKLSKKDSKGNFRQVVLIKRDGSVVKRIGKNCYLSCWWHASPKENPSKNQFEIGYLPNDGGARGSAYAVLIDFSGATPKVLGERQVAKGLGTNEGEFDLAGDMLIWDYKVNSRDKPSLNVTIPNKGMGVAGREHIYGSRTGSNCASWLNTDGKLWAANGSGDGKCMPKNHVSFFVLKTKKSTEPKSRFYDWLYKAEKGAVSVNWAPQKIDGMATGNVDLIDWFGWRFSRNNEYVIGHNTPRKNGARVPYGLFIVHWPTNTWYKLMPSGTYAVDGALYFDNYKPGTAISPRSVVARTPRNSNVARSQWRNILGRATPGSIVAGTPGALGVTVGRGDKSISSAKAKGAAQ